MRPGAEIESPGNQARTALYLSEKASTRSASRAMATSVPSIFSLDAQLFPTEVPMA